MSASFSGDLSATSDAQSRPLLVLPDCHSRREHDPEKQLFFCAHPRMHTRDSLVYPAICRLCPYWNQPAPTEFRPRPLNFMVRDGLCAQLGPLIELRDCPSCRGQVQVKVYACLHPAHEETTIDDCTRCRDYQKKRRDDQTG